MPKTGGDSDSDDSFDWGSDSESSSSSSEDEGQYQSIRERFLKKLVYFMFYLSGIFKDNSIINIFIISSFLLDQLIRMMTKRKRKKKNVKKNLRNKNEKKKMKVIQNGKKYEEELLFHR